jgi:signal transduction histidine kinase
MSAIASWTRRRRPEIAWAAFAAANFAVLFSLLDYQTVPFHFVWVSLTMLYGFRVWAMRPTMLVLAAVCAASAVTLGAAAIHGYTGADELTEIPLMSAMFFAMVWHARRRQAALEEARRAAERERAFIRDASHQLKTPIAVARGLAELLRDSERSSARRRDIVDLVEELDRLGGIAEDLVLLEVAEQPDSLEHVPVDIEDLVVSAVRRWSRGAQRRWRVDVTVEGTLIGDRQRLDAALDAVLENAVQATGERDRVEITAAPAGAGVVVTVRDTGVGIPEELLPRVFERFAGDRRRDGKRSTGLGLPIARAIVEAHGGTIAAASVPGRQTVITLELPGPITTGPAEPLRSVAA